MNKLPLIVISLLSLLIFFSCVKEEFVLDENIHIPDFDPVFGAPLVSTSLNLNDLEQNLDNQNFIYNTGDQMYVFAYNQDIIEYKISDLIDIPSQSIEYQYVLDDVSATNINALPPGFTTSFTASETHYLEVNNAEELDSIILNTASLNLLGSSEINQDISIDLSLPNLTLGGVPFTTNLNFDFTGTLPVNIIENLDLTGYTLDLTNGGSDSNAIPMVFELTFTKTTGFVSEGDYVDFEFNFILDDFHAIYGYFGQNTNVIQQDTQRIDFFENLQEGEIYFADPSINLTIYNEIGLDAEVSFNTILAPDNSSTIALGGPDLTSIPLIEGADFPGDETITLHTIDNSGTSPQLSDLLLEGPSSLIYEATASINPEGYQQNFAIDTSTVRINAEIVLPMFLYANDFIYVDTVDVDLASELQFDPGGTVNEDDIKSITLRIIADNGLPINIGTQVYIADSMNNVIDSLFQVSDYHNVFQSGLVNFSLDINDPNYGKVYQSKRTITDIVLTDSMIENIKNTQANKIIFRAKALTTNAGNGDVVKFFPEYTLDLKLSAKIETNIDLSN